MGKRWHFSTLLVSLTHGGKIGLKINNKPQKISRSNCISSVMSKDGLKPNYATEDKDYLSNYLWLNNMLDHTIPQLIVLNLRQGWSTSAIKSFIVAIKGLIVFRPFIRYQTFGSYNQYWNVRTDMAIKLCLWNGVLSRD